MSLRSSPRSVSPLWPTTVPILMSRSRSACLLLGLLRRRAGERGFHEIRPIENVAAHRHAQHAVAAAVGLERDLVAIRQAEHRKIRRHDLARVVEFDRALHVRARTGDGEIVEARGLRGLDQRVGGVRRLAGRLHPARQQVVDLHRREIGIHVHRRVLAVVADPRRELDRDRAGDGAAEIDAEPAARGFVDHRLQCATRRPHRPFSCSNRWWPACR